MIGPILALAFWSAAGRHPREISHERVRADHWTVDVRRDSFTGETQCVLRGPDVTLSHQVLTFRFRPSVDTANALFRADLGPVRNVGLMGPEAAGLGARLSSDDLGNPSGGRVHIPAHYLRSTKSVRIRPNPRGNDKVFDLGGLDAAVAAANQKGCGVQSPT